MILSHGKKWDAVDADHVLFEATPRLATTIDERLPQRPQPEAVASQTVRRCRYLIKTRAPMKTKRVLLGRTSGRLNNHSPFGNWVPVWIRCSCHVVGCSNMGDVANRHRR
jgi:hypothetical protein